MSEATYCEREDPTTPEGKGGQYVRSRGRRRRGLVVVLAVVVIVAALPFGLRVLDAVMRTI